MSGKPNGRQKKSPWKGMSEAPLDGTVLLLLYRVGSWKGCPLGNYNDCKECGLRYLVAHFSRCKCEWIDEASGQAIAGGNLEWWTELPAKPS